MAGSGRVATTNDAFDEAFETVRSLVSQVERDEIKTRYRVGLLLREVVASVEIYGERAVERLAERLEVGADTLYRCITVAETWSESELHALASRTNCFGERFTWSHLATLAKIPGDGMRGRWTDRCLEAGWTTQELAQHLVGEHQGPSSHREVTRHAVRVGLAECAQNALRARVQMRLARESLERQPVEEADVEEPLLERAIREHEELRAETDATLAWLQQASRTSMTRVRVGRAVPAANGEAIAGAPPRESLWRK
jgi:hypothetical protein